METSSIQKKALSPQGKVVCLISGGIDSPVAAWLTIKKGFVPIFVYCDNYPFTDQNTKIKALDTVEKLGKYTIEHAKLYVIPHGEDLADIIRNCPRNLTCILCRRMMYRLAERVAKIESADAIVTGEIIGEHASQTLRNLRVENMVVTDVCMLRPLVALDKLQVERLAHNIGTFEISTRPGHCCSGPPSQPRTHARLEEAVKAEEKLDIKGMIERNMKNIIEMH